MSKKQLISLHAVYWILQTIGSIIIDEFVLGNGETFVLSLTFLSVSIAAFYINYFWIAPFFFKRKETVWAIAGFFTAVLCFTLLRYVVEQLLAPLVLGYSNYPLGTNLGYYLYDNIYFSSVSIFVSTSLWLFKRYSTIEAERSLLLEEKQRAQLQALKNQINPHFIFNSLNNIYSLVYQQSEKALSALEELSRLLRYSTKDIEKDFIPLGREIEYITSLIALEKLRLVKPNLIIVEEDISNPGLLISPMLLVPFVENAFKHGDTNKHGFSLKIKEENSVLHFVISNWKSNGPRDKSAGIGLANVRNRLQILYRDRHEFNVTESDGDFTVNLKIDLAND